MQYTIIITKRPDLQWRAFAPGWPDCSAEGTSREEVLTQIRQKLADAVNYSEIVRIDLSTSDQSASVNTEVIASDEWSDFGIFKDDPSWKKLFAEIEESRNQRLAVE